jgi:hypothetical protein
MTSFCKMSARVFDRLGVAALYCMRFADICVMPASRREFDRFDIFCVYKVSI